VPEGFHNLEEISQSALLHPMTHLTRLSNSVDIPYHLRYANILFRIKPRIFGVYLDLKIIGHLNSSPDVHLRNFQISHSKQVMGLVLNFENLDLLM